MSVTRKGKVATVGQAKQTLCTFIVKGGGILVTDADGQNTTTFAARDAALKHVANVVAVAWRTPITEEAVA